KRAVAKTINAVGRAELAFVPQRELHGQGRIERRFAATPTQAGADAEQAVILWQGKVRSRVIVPAVSRVVGRAAQHAIQRNSPAGIEQVINAEREFTAKAGEGLGSKVLTLIDLCVIVGEAAAGDTHAQVRIFAQGAADAQLGSQVRWGHG